MAMGTGVRGIAKWAKSPRRMLEPTTRRVFWAQVGIFAHSATSVFAKIIVSSSKRKIVEFVPNRCRARQIAARRGSTSPAWGKSGFCLSE